MQIKTWDFFATIIYLIGTSITSIEILAINVIGIDSGIWYIGSWNCICSAHIASICNCFSLSVSLSVAIYFTT